MPMSSTIDTNHQLQKEQQVAPPSSQNPWRRTWQRFLPVLLTAVLCGGILTGCQDFFDTTSDLLRLDGDEAEAQVNRDTQRVETFVIDSALFNIEVDRDVDSTPTHDVRDGGAIEFTMQSTGTVTFNLSGGERRDEPLENGDTVILTLNGNTSTVTIIRTLSN